MSSPRRPSSLLVIQAAALLLATSLAGAAASPLTVEDILALLNAGVGEKVILGQAEGAGTGMTLTVETILKLKKAGASDDLLAALIGLSAGAPATEPMAVDVAATGPSTSSFRIYRERNDKGEEVLHITNLDESGRRIGGEVADGRPANVVQGGTIGPDERRERDETQPSVVVNIYPPEAAQSPLAESGYIIDDEPPYSMVEYGGYVGGHLRGYSRHCPDPRDSFGGYLSRPGSYSNALLYRGAGPRGADLALFSQPRSFSTLPYRVHTAAERNRMRFGHR